jgi:hypothetical protein
VNDVVRRHLLRQAGIITRAQALAAGLSARQIDHLLSTREWLVAFTGVYRLHASVPLPETGLMAASLWLGPSVLLADEGAAWWWGVLPDPPARWTFVGHSRRRPHADVRVVDAFVDPQDRWTHRGLPVLSRPWSVLRAAAAREKTRAGSGIAVIDHRLAIELDGFAFHSSPSSFRRDLRRSNRLMADGWTVRRFSWDDVVGDPQGFIDTVLELLAL